MNLQTSGEDDLQSFPTVSVLVQAPFSFCSGQELRPNNDPFLSHNYNSLDVCIMNGLIGLCPATDLLPRIYFHLHHS
jgi:hypothetical protein